jgi:arsenate reductase (thioredoxin)
VITVLFACVQNAGRSQIAETLFNLRADPTRARAISAGTSPAAHVHGEVVALLRRAHGVDLSSRVPQRLSDQLAQQAQWLITMGCGDQCPIVPGARRDDWPIRDPKGQPEAIVQDVLDDIDARVQRLIAEQGWARPDRT